MTVSPTKPKSGMTLTLTAESKEQTMQAIINLAIVLMPIWVMLIAIILEEIFNVR